MEIRRSYYRFISTMGFPIEVSHYAMFYIESGPWFKQWKVKLVCWVWCHVYNFITWTLAHKHDIQNFIWLNITSQCINTIASWWTQFSYYRPFVWIPSRRACNAKLVMFPVLLAWTFLWTNKRPTGKIKHINAQVRSLLLILITPCSVPIDSVI